MAFWSIHTQSNEVLLKTVFLSGQMLASPLPGVEVPQSTWSKVGKGLHPAFSITPKKIVSCSFLSRALKFVVLLEITRVTSWNT